MFTGMDDPLLLARHQGFVTARGAHALGISRSTLHRLVRADRLEHVPGGIYLLPEPRTPEQRHALVTRAVLSEDPFAHASHQSALALQDIPLIGVPLDRVHIADARASSRRRQSVHRHVLRDGDAVTRYEGWRTLALPLACLQLAARCGVRSGVVAADACLHRGLVEADELTAIIESGRLRRGLVAAREAARLADGTAESPGESLLRLVLNELPVTVSPQVEIAGTPYRVDFLVDGRVVVEFDGDIKYNGPDAVDVHAKEKARQAHLERLGYIVVRVKWAELGSPATIRSIVHAAVVRARAAAAGAA